VRLSDVAEVGRFGGRPAQCWHANGKPSVLSSSTGSRTEHHRDDRARPRTPAAPAGSIPSTINLEVVLERTSTIRASLREVERTLVIAIALVIMCVPVPAQRSRDADSGGRRAGFARGRLSAWKYLAGFSLNNLSLMRSR